MSSEKEVLDKNISAPWNNKSAESEYANKIESGKAASTYLEQYKFQCHSIVTMGTVSGEAKNTGNFLTKRVAHGTRID